MSFKVLKSAALLSLGAALGQAVGLAALPLLARVYSPELFGAFGTYVAAVAICSLIGTLKLEVALIKADSERDARALFWAGCASSSLMGLLCALATGAWSVVGAPPVWTFAIPPSVVLFGILQLSYGYCNRQQKYGSMAFRKGANAVLTVFFQLLLAWILQSDLGLVLGYLISLAIITALIAKQVTDWIWPPMLCLSTMRSVVSAYRSFVTQLLPASIANVASWQLPTVFLAAYYGLTTGGYYTFAAITLGAPVSIVASAVGEVLRQRVSADIREGRRLGSATWMPLGLLALCGTLVYLAINEFSELIVRLLGGDEWMGAVKVVDVIAPLLAVQFVGNPMGYILSVLDGHRNYVVLQAFQISALFLVALACVVLKADSIPTISAIVLVQVATYVGTTFEGIRLMRARNTDGN